MTEPRTGPGSEPGQPGGPGRPGSGPAPGMGQDSMNSGNTDPGRPGGAGQRAPARRHRRAGQAAGSGASSTGVTTAARTTAAQASVPQQYGRESEYGSGMGGEAAMPGASARGGCSGQQPGGPGRPCCSARSA